MILTTNISSQSTTFSKVFNKLNGNEYGSELEITDDGYLLFCRGIVFTSDSTYYAPDYMLKVDTELIEINFYEYKNLFFCTMDAVSKSNDSLFFLGNDMETYNKWLLYKLDRAGDSLDLIIFDDFADEDTSVLHFAEGILLKDDYMYMAGRTWGKYGMYVYYEDMFIIKADKQGRKIKEERFYDFATPKRQNVERDMIKTLDGNFVVAITSLNHNDMTAKVLKFDEDLNPIWMDTSATPVGHPLTLPHVTPTQDSGFVMVNCWDDFKIKGYPSIVDYEGYPLVFIKYDVDGNKEWTDTLFMKRLGGNQRLEPGTRRSISGLLTAKNGDIIAYGEYQHPIIHPKERAFLLRYSPDGVLKWSHYYINADFPTSTTDILDVKEAENGDLICLGDVNNVDGEWNNTDYTWLFRVDSTGCMEPGCELSDTVTGVMVAINEIYFKEIKQIKLYPNPVDVVLTVELPQSIPWGYYSILDMTGKSIKTGKVAGNIFDVDVSSLHIGIYFLRALSKDGRMVVGKFVVE